MTVTLEFRKLEFGINQAHLGLLFEAVAVVFSCTRKSYRPSLIIDDCSKFKFYALLQIR